MENIDKNLDEFEAANRRGAARLARTPVVIAAYYDSVADRLVIELSSGVSISFRLQDVEGFEQVQPEQIAEIEIVPPGFGLYFPTINADLYLPSLAEHFLGSREWMTEQLGKAGGKATSPAKAAAAQANGKRGGRPPKKVEEINIAANTTLA